MQKINIFCIFSEHFKTLRHYSREKISFGDVALFFIFPFLIAGILTSFLPSDFLSKISTELITFYSVFGGFMLNLLVLVYGFDLKKFKNPEIAEGVLKEIAANISYLVTLASLAILLLFIVKVSGFLDTPAMLIVQGFNIIFAIKQITVVFIIGSLLNFSLTILMVLRRFYALDQNKRQQ